MFHLSRKSYLDLLGFKIWFDFQEVIINGPIAEMGQLLFIAWGYGLCG